MQTRLACLGGISLSLDSNGVSGQPGLNLIWRHMFLIENLPNKAQIWHLWLTICVSNVFSC